MNFLSRLKLWQKLAVLVVAMAIPSALLGIFYLGGANSQVALAKVYAEVHANNSHWRRSRATRTDWLFGRGDRKYQQRF